ncbi:efflux RND transporter periplasmic adaptor subunit [Pedobacter glucosidilyticus]|uniref:efflux RND transporter periplasmic adaptor subunit n=1 Tax=Pedobacter glucosidilyticus TaxID=1122941 RepID=UPI0026ECD159|nr:efflux RND transporter periplasmic adaptor subunit [Pedobacter glucosidilyticus]
MKTKYIIYILIIGLLGYMIYNRLNKSSETKGPKGGAATSGNAPISVSGIIVKPTQFSNVVSVSGTIEANEQVQIRSEISGLIRSINFTEGSTVNKGALLIKIDDRELQAQLAQALTREKLASETESRSKKLLQSEAISQEEYDNTLAELRSLQAQSQLVRAQLSKTEIRAPFSGKIGLRSISNGAYITPTTDIVNLVNINPVKITFSVPEKYAKRVKEGSGITFTVAGSRETFSAKVYAIEPAIDIATRTLILRARAENPKGILLPGTFANVNLPLENINDAILVPTEAVVPILNGKQVFIAENGKAKAVKIESDVRTDKEVLVSTGLKAGDTVLTTGVMALKPDAPVKVSVKNK